jgi:hypothetical protein
MNRIVIVVALFYSLTARADQTLSNGPILSGTINVVAANPSEIVVLTDSMLSYRVPDGHGRWQYRQIPAPAQKLFQIDDHTVCAFAGFASAPTPPLPEFLNNVSAIIGRYKGSLRDSAAHTIAEKLDLLSGVFGYYLRGIANIREPDDYYLELFVAGYDPDGTVRVGSVILGTRPDSSGLLDPITIEKTVVSVQEQRFFVHGQRRLAEQILEQPAPWAHDTAVKAYVQSKRDQRPLSLEQLKALAIFLKQQTSSENPTVGGPNQIAILRRGHVDSLELPKFPTVTATGFKFVIFEDMHYEAGELSSKVLPDGLAGGAYVGDGLFALYFKSSFDHVIQQLDDGYFNGSTFEGCRVLYDGGPLQFEMSNRVHNSELILGSGVDRNAPAVMSLMYNFPWKHIGHPGEINMKANH